MTQDRAEQNPSSDPQQAIEGPDPAGNPAADGGEITPAADEVEAQPADAEDEPEAAAAEPEATLKISPTELLVDCALGEGIELFHDESGQPHATVPTTGGRRVMALPSRDFELWLMKTAWRKFNRSFSRESRTAAIDLLACQARFEGEQIPLATRLAGSTRTVLIDLDGSRAVRVVPRHWEIVERPPILFRHFPHQRPLPVPVHGGDLHQLLRFVNLPRPEDRLLLLCLLVAALVPGIPLPVLIVHGPQGAAKSTLLKLIKRLLDPSQALLIGAIKALDEFAVVAVQHRVLFLDNLTSMPAWLSDALCRAVTGDGLVKRTLFTNADTTTLAYRCLVGMSGICNVVDKPDLLDRALILQLPPISAEGRQEETAYWAAFDAAEPSILGGMLDAHAMALEIAPSLHLTRRPRMADFARWGAAAAIALGSTQEDFLAAYQANIGRQTEAAIDASPVASAVVEFMRDKPDWRGRSAELLEALNKVAESEHLDRHAGQWPRTGYWLHRRLREVEANLLALGISFKADRTARCREIELRRVGGDGVIGVTGVTVAATAAAGPLAMTPSDSLGRDGVTNGVIGRSSGAAPDTPHDASDASDAILAHTPALPAGAGGAESGADPVRVGVRE